jgi:uncharacterized ferredoxin-like protein
MLKREEDIRGGAIWSAAQEVLLAMRTAPKTRGIDNVSLLLVDGDEKAALSAKMDEIFERSGGKRASFARDAKNVMVASSVLVAGVKSPAYGLDCGWCGFADCAAKGPGVPCVFGAIDLGIASGVAASKLAGKHIDNRMMYSIGVAALELGWFEKDVTMALGFPLSATGKSPFFDRK